MKALLGGSFDPIHLGHLDIANQLLAYYSFDEIIFVPAYQNPLKSGPKATSQQRKRMVELALKDSSEERLRMVDWELMNPGPSYTVETLEKLVNREGDMVLLVGDEVFREFTQWKLPKRILDLASVVVFARTPGAKDPRAEVLPKLGFPAPAGRIPARWNLPNRKWVDWAPLKARPISSSEIRAQLLAGVAPTGVAPVVQRFIKENSLYSENK